MIKQTLGSLKQDKVIAFGDGYRTNQSELGTSGFRVIRAADVRAGEVSFTGDDFVRQEFQSQIGAKATRAGDVVLTTKGTVGRVALVREVVGQAVYSPQLCWFRVLDDTVLDPGYLLAWLQSPEFAHQSSHMQANTDMAPYISLSDLRSAQISLPAIDVQRAVGEVLGALEAKIAANARENRALARVRNLLLPELISGGTCVRDIKQIAETLESNNAMVKNA